MKHYLIILLFCLATTLGAQVTNDDCFTAINIASIDDYCSGNEEFTNIGASADNAFTNICFLGFDNGVWFSFIPREPSVIINVLSGPSLGSMSNPRIALFSDQCNNLSLLSCSPGRSALNDELVVSDLIIGQRYYLYVESGSGLEGTFTLCINDFISPPSPQSDCVDGVILCDKSSFQVESLTTAGLDDTELDQRFPDQCLTQEFNSSWYKWTCEQAGSLTFTITPNNYIPGLESDDIDFALFRLPNGLNDCQSKEMIRCMASGANGTFNQANVFIPDPFNEWDQCNGPTGLSLSDSDIQEFQGCVGANDNNFADGIQMIPGESYALVVMNFSATGLGFSIEFGGTGTFLGPQPDFDIIATAELICDKEIQINNNSNSLTDPIVSYFWSFGTGATPQSATGEGPFNVTYSNIGTKSIILTVESSKGCITSQIKEIEIGSCCENVNLIQLDLQPTNIVCNGDNSGEINVLPSDGIPPYLFSLNGQEYSPNTIYNNLGAGTYEVSVIDSKGCEVSETVTISEPPPIIADAGADITVDLGFSGQLQANYSPMQPGDIIEWSPAEGLSCTDCLSPEVTPPGTTTYTFTVTNADGCTAQDQVLVTANLIRPVYFPNVITPTTNDINSVFTLGFGPQASEIVELKVFDRWGNPIFICENIPPNDPTQGWDGRFGRCNETFTDLVNPGVFVWIAKVRFIDNEIITYIDEVTVLK